MHSWAPLLLQLLQVMEADRSMSTTKRNNTVEALISNQKQCSCATVHCRKRQLQTDLPRPLQLAGVWWTKT